MPNIVALLKAERDKLARQLNGLNAALAAFAGAYGRADGATGQAEVECQGSCEYSSRTESTAGKREERIHWQS
jgi:hypothetical protein